MSRPLLRPLSARRGRLSARLPSRASVGVDSWLRALRATAVRHAHPEQYGTEVTGIAIVESSEAQGATVGPGARPDQAPGRLGDSHLTRTRRRPPLHIGCTPTGRPRVRMRRGPLPADRVQPEATGFQASRIHGGRPGGLRTPTHLHRCIPWIRLESDVGALPRSRDGDSRRSSTEGDRYACPQPPRDVWTSSIRASTPLGIGFRASSRRMYVLDSLG
jgi:hypothetical protein